LNVSCHNLNVNYELNTPQNYLGFKK
jgi:hypothetical protein